MSHPFTKFFHAHAAPVFGLLFTAILVFLPANDTIIHSDDWDYLIHRFITGKLYYIDWHDRRPLVGTGFKLLLDIFGINLKALYIVQILFILACAVIIYFISLRLFIGYEHLAFLTALVFLIYPVDYTRMWLIQSYTWLIYLVTLGSLYLLLLYANGGHWWTLAAALLLVILPLGAYEAQLGLVAVGTILLAVFTRKVSLSRRFALTSPLIILAVFAVWRVYIQPQILHIHDPYISTMNFSLGTLLERLSNINVFATSWVQPFYKRGSILSINRLFALLLGGMFISAVIVIWVSREPSESQYESIPWAERWSGLKRLAKIVGVGFVLLIAGYIPILLIYWPNLKGDATRFNLFAISGGALMLVGLIGIIALLAAQRSIQVRQLAAGAIIPLIIIGAFHQITIQNEARLAWVEQEHFWQDVFTALPNMKDNTLLVVVMPGGTPERYFARPPLVAEWEILYGLRTLYNNSTLFGTLYYSDGVQRSGVQLDPNAIGSYEIMPTPYSRTIFIRYNPGNRGISVLKNLREELSLPFAPAGYNPQQNIQPYETTVGRYRRLIK